MIRSWNEATRLNDRPFVDAPLKAGDRLGIGPLEWEVINGSQIEVPVESSAVSAIAAAASPLADMQQRLDSDAAALAQFRQKLDLDRERWEAESAAARLERDAWQTERSAWLAERAAAEAALEEKKRLLADENEALTQQTLGLTQSIESAVREREQLDLERQQLASIRTSLDDELKAAEQIEHDLKSQRETIEAEKLNLDATARQSRDAEQSAIEAERRTVTQEQQALEEARRAFDAERQALAAERESLENQRQSIESQSHSLNAKNEQFDAAFAAWEAEKQSLMRDKEQLDAARRSFEEERAAVTASAHSGPVGTQVDAEQLAQLADGQRALAAEREALVGDRQSLQIEWQTLDMQLQGLAAERQMIASQRQSLEVQEQRLATEQQSNETQRQMIESERRAFDSQRAQLAADANQSSRRVVDQQAALTATREAFEKQRELWQTERDQLQTRISEELDRCQRQLAELNRMRQDLERERMAWDEHRQAEEANLAACHELLERQSAELEAHARRLEQQQAMAAANAPATGENRAAAVGWTATGAGQMQNDDSQHNTAMEASSIPDSEADAVRREEEVFARLRSYSLLKVPSADQSDAQTTEAGRVAGQQPAETEEPPAVLGEFLDRNLEYEEPSQVPATAASDDEESVDDYMARLLTRIRGSSPTGDDEPAPAARPAPRPVAATTASPPGGIERRVQTADVAPEIERRAPQAPAVPAQLVARSAPPELGVNLKAMRELANLTTRGAIDKHAQGRWSKVAVGKLIGGSLSVICGIWLIFFQGSGFGSLSHWVGMAGAVAGGFWISQGAVVVRNLRTVARRANKFVEHETQTAGHQNHADDAEQSPAPAEPESDGQA